MDPPDRLLGANAARHQGVIASDQVRPDLTSSQLWTRNRRGQLDQPIRGTFVIAGTPPSWRRDLAVLVAAGGPGTAVSHRSAGLIHGLGRFPELLEVATPRQRRFRTDFKDAIIHTSLVIPDEDLVETDGLVVTSIDRTILDLGAVVNQRRVQQAVDTALREGKTSLVSLNRLLEARRKRGRRGCGVLARVLESPAVALQVESRYEREILDLAVAMGLPLPATQHVVTGRWGQTYRLDLAWPDHRIAVEVDGHGFHATRAERAVDSARQNELQLMGWKVVRFTTDQIHSTPDGVAKTLADTLLPFL